MGRRRDERITKMMAEQIKASLGGTPMSSASIAGTNSTAALLTPQLIGMQQPNPAMFQALARDTPTFGGGLGPGFPLVPQPLDFARDSTGRPNPRKFQYDVADNLNITKRLAQWNVLSSAALQVDLFSRAIAIRQADMLKMDWSWNISKDAINVIMEDNNIGHAEANRLARKLYMKDITRMSEVWENPYPQTDRSWEEWITEALWQILVYDGLAIHPHMNLGRKVIGLDIIEASTIKVLLNNEGDTPRPPDAAYQQVLFGFPRGEFTASTNHGVNNFMAGEYNISERDQLSYFVQNRRTNSPYGLSPVEISLEIGNVYMERLRWMLAEYKFGTKASVYIPTSTSEITHENMSSWARILNDQFAGQTNERQSHVFLPDGFGKPEFAPSIEEKYKADWDEYLIKRIASHFGIMPTQFGVIPRTGIGGKGGSEGSQDEAESVSTKPQNKYIERIVNVTSRRYYDCPRFIEFSLQNDEGSEDEVEISTANKNYVSFGSKTLNDVRGEMGLPLYDMPEADEPMIVTPTGPVFLKNLLAAQTEPQEAPSGPPPTQTPPPPPESGSPQAQPEEASGTSSGEAPSPNLDADKSAEVKAYKRFVRSGKSRDFTFLHHSVDEIDSLKAGLVPHPKLSKSSSEDTPQFKKLAKLADKHSAALYAALAAGVTGVAIAITQAMRSSTQVQAAGAIADLAAQSVSIDTTAASAILSTLYVEAGKLGGEYAAGADAVASQSVQALLDQREFALKGITRTVTGHVGTAIEQGLTNGDSHTAIADQIRSQVLGPMLRNQSDTISITETNRAYNAAFVDNLQAAGFTSWTWMTDGDPCEECIAQEGDHTFDDPAPPEHPNCNCIATTPTQ